MNLTKTIGMIMNTQAQTKPSGNLGLKIIKAPNKTKMKMIGANQYFFLTFINSQNSFIIDIFDIFIPPK